MTPALLVRRAGPATTIQDLGRWGHQRLGVPVGGALDTTSLRLANAVVGNGEGVAGFEFRLAGPDLVVDADSVRVALAGAVETFIEADPPMPVAPWRSVTLIRGQVLRIRRVTVGAVGYLAVAGGLAVESVLGSRSTYVRAGLGSFDGRVLGDGDRVPLAADRVDASGERALPSAPEPGTGPLRVVLGPQDDAFTEEAMATFLGQSFTVGRAADRMGLRLDGARLTHRTDANIISDGVATGAIQVPANGQPILLLADRQTVGGYTKIATVVSADLPRAGHLLPGAELRFAAVTVAQAIDLRRQAEAAIARLVAGIRAVPPVGGLDEGALMTQNLISGVVGAADATG
ncbi:MAG: biotin-dependent carboxyltransferase family protein [Alphaproteobacteria bacterium]